MRESENLMATDRAHYQAYMLRIWQDLNEPSSVWRASLESPHTGKRHGFTSLEALFDFLRQRADQQVDGSPTLTQAASGGSD